jgi:Nif-specific ferredoxin III
MATITGLTKGGAVWVPKFLEAIDPEKCIACGRCFKVCARTVLELVPRTDDGDDEGNKVMAAAHPDDCIGCSACSRVCAKKSLSFAEV